MSNVTIGVIGAGLIGRKHLRKLSEQPDYDLVGIADVNVDAVAAEYPKTRVFADYRKLLDEARPQAVLIASPNQLHAETGIGPLAIDAIALCRQDNPNSRFRVIGRWPLQD